MDVSNISPQEELLKDNSVFTDMIRYCLSDKVTHSVDHVYAGGQSPVGYARKITQTHWKQIYNDFGHYDLKDISLTDNLKKAWVYDRLLSISSYYRASKIRPRKAADAAVLVHTSFPYTLLLKEKSLTEGSWIGLSYFQSCADDFLRAYQIQRTPDEIGLIDRFCMRIGDQAKQGWLFHKPLWFKTFSSYSERLDILRGFLHIVLVCHIKDEEFSIKNYQIEKSYLTRLTIQLLDLIEDDDTTFGDINLFLSEVEEMALRNYDSDFLNSYFKLNYASFEQAHQSTFGSHYNSKVLLPTLKEYDKPEWKELRSISPQFFPEKVVETNITIDEYLDTLIKEEAVEVFCGALDVICKNRDIELPRSITKEWNWLKAFMRDYLYLSLVQKRLVHLKPNLVERVEAIAEFQSHILLITDDDNERGGLSLIQEMLPLHIECNKENYSPHELEVLSSLNWAWNKLSIRKPNRMHKSWKKILKDKGMRSNLRTVMYTLIEAINIPWGECDENYITYTREELFSYIEVFTEYLSGTPTTEEMTEFFLDMPMMKGPVTSTKWDISVWLFPFDSISPPPKEDEILEHV